MVFPLGLELFQGVPLQEAEGGRKPPQSVPNALQLVWRDLLCPEMIKEIPYIFFRPRDGGEADCPEVLQCKASNAGGSKPGITQ